MTGSRYQSSISRRDFLKVTGTLGAALAGSSLLAACSPKAQEINLTHFVWVGGGQGIVPREVVPAYEQAHPNVHIELYEGTNSVTYPKMVAAKEADPNNPLINFGFFNIDATVKGAKDDMWISLDPNKIPNMNDIYPQYWRPENKGIAWGVSEMGIMYNTDLVKDPPTSWLDLVDPKWQGKVVMFDYSFNDFLCTIARSIGGSEKDDEGAWKLITEAAKRGQFLAFGSSNEDIKSPIVRGEALIAPWFYDLAKAWADDEGVPLAVAEPKEGFMVFPLLFQIVKGSTQAQIDVASDIINTYLSAETLARYCSLTKTPSTSKTAVLDPELAKDPAFSKETIDRAMNMDWDTIAARDVEWHERWDREVKGVMP
jgi:putative spermidine/putrescine transport system substrate-binding protein